MSNPVWQDLQRLESVTTSGTDGTAGAVFETKGRTYMAFALSLAELGTASSIAITFEASWDQSQWFDVRDASDNVVTVTVSSDFNTSPAEADQGWFRALDGGDGIHLAVPAPFWRVKINPAASPVGDFTLEYQLVAFDA